MFLLDGTLCWSASDLTAAADCEYALLRRLDLKLGQIDAVAVENDPLMEHIGRLGDRHEARLLADVRSSGDVAELRPVEPPYTAAALDAAGDATFAALDTQPDVVYQAAFFDGEFFGYADFLERSDEGWVVCDAKLARHAKPRALLQLGAYADQLRSRGVPVAPKASLLLGDGSRADFPLADILPAFAERRDLFRASLDRHRGRNAPAAWDDDSITVCGRCPECRAAAEASDDLSLVAGMRMDQRRKLHEVGIRTLGELASSTGKPAAMASATFDKLRSQASLQHRQRAGGEGAPLEYELTEGAGKAFELLPAPSAGDLFFDFEGDPLYDEGDPGRVGLEYLWGVLDTEGEYLALWAHSWQQEREAFTAFMGLLAERRAAHPDLHVYHYAPYETTALKRLAIRHQVREEELDDLLRAGVFVDLYSTVRAALRVGAASYSIKKLEPLYMGDELRSDEDDAVGDGGASVVAYHEYRELALDHEDASQQRLAALADYNEYDCLSTLRLRDWLLERAAEIPPPAVTEEAPDEVDAKPVRSTKRYEVDQTLLSELLEKATPDDGGQRSREQQTYALLAAALGYYERESKQFWWEHYERLANPIDAWREARDVFVVESAEVEQDWRPPTSPHGRNHKRTLRLTGDWTAGSRPHETASAVYATPAPHCKGSRGGLYAAGNCTILPADADQPRVARVVESKPPGEVFDDLPVALVPGAGPNTESIEKAIAELAVEARSTASLPRRAALDILTRRAPRTTTGAPIDTSASDAAAVAAALRAMSDSYVAVQGPPGTGKTYTGARVIKQLVEQHGWKIGVVAQSHAVVENMLDGAVRAGVDPGRVGKAKPESDDPLWTPVEKVDDFVSNWSAHGFVLGGTAWDFVNDKKVERGELDLLVVDEAGQFSLAATLGVSVAADRLLLLGDPQQLPQVSQGSHPEPVDESALGWLLDGHATIPRDRGFFLDRSYRMHPELCAKVSVHSYEGRLESATAAAARHLDGVEPGLSVALVDHAGNRSESPEEAAEVVAQVRAHLGAMWLDPDESAEPRPLGPADFLVVAPYNAQVACIRQALDAADLGAVRVGTVDKFQGREAPVAIVSTTASSHDDVPRGMDFLLDRHRVNVSVSRAKWRAIVIRSTSLTHYMPTTSAGVLQLGSFISLCRSDVRSSLA